ncbi:MAG TPA: hypothetical protein DCL61_29655 [Cyanobacteria bacterium UBA12227]|nr:hypothetical protein [Cyanobacteria bacterium UBA12227]HAX87220.1 hypothetical protein [Cyanobacteria bacterium UBA11370]HBY80850.1 hypothetical protein [Cyanobacteria bacterium UBA11148]
MRVKRLNINSFRGIGEMTLDFSESEPTVFIGVNGVGKSSILDSLAILLSWMLAPIQFDPNARGSFMTKENGTWTSKSQYELAQGREFTQQDIKNGAKKIGEEITLSIHSEEIKWSLPQTQIKQNTDENTNFVNLEQFTQDIRTQLNTNHRTNRPLAVYYPINRFVLGIPLQIPANNHDLYNALLREQGLATVT